MSGYKGVPTIRKRLIGSQLRRLRDETGLSIDEAAAKMGVGPFTVRRQESGHTAVSVADAKAYAAIYDVQDDAVLNRLTDLARHGRARGWWSAYDTTVGPSVVDVADIEDLAREYKTWQPLAVPGVLQTREYSEAVISVGSVLRTPDHPLPVEELIALRERRKGILHRADPPRVWAIIGEAAVRTQVGGPQVMHDQIEHLLSLGEMANIAIQVMPYSAGAHLGLGGAFVVMSFDATLEGSVTFLENSGPTHTFSDEPVEVGQAATRFTHLQAQALSTGESRTYLQEVISAK